MSESAPAPDFNAPVGDVPGFYAEVGGGAVFARIADRFYEQVADDVVLRPMYPDDLGPARERMRAFLVQYCGGPPEYAQLRGAPRLRVRHAAFRIGPVQRTAWVRCMRVAVEESGLDEAHRRWLWDYLRRAALGLVNTGYR